MLWLVLALLTAINDCPDSLGPKSNSNIVAKVVPRLEKQGATTRLSVDVSYTNAGSTTEGMDHRYFGSSLPGNQPRTDFLWLFDRRSRTWLRYVGPQERLRERRRNDYFVISPGETKTTKDMDVTWNYVLPASPPDLVAKIMFHSSWPGHFRGALVESGCVPFERVRAR